MLRICVAVLNMHAQRCRVAKTRASCGQALQRHGCPVLNDTADNQLTYSAEVRIFTKACAAWLVERACGLEIELMTVIGPFRLIAEAYIIPANT